MVCRCVVVLCRKEISAFNLGLCLCNYISTCSVSISKTTLRWSFGILNTCKACLVVKYALLGVSSYHLATSLSAYFSCDFTSLAKEVMFSVAFVCLFVCYLSVSLFVC